MIARLAGLPLTGLLPSSKLLRRELEKRVEQAARCIASRLFQLAATALDINTSRWTAGASVVGDLLEHADSSLELLRLERSVLTKRLAAPKPLLKNEALEVFLEIQSSEVRKTEKVVASCRRLGVEASKQLRESSSRILEILLSSLASLTRAKSHEELDHLVADSLGQLSRLFQSCHRDVRPRKESMMFREKPLDKEDLRRGLLSSENADFSELVQLTRVLAQSRRSEARLEALLLILQSLRDVEDVVSSMGEILSF